MELKQLTANMEHISRADLAEHLDEYLDKVDKEQVGIIISDEGKKDLILCPVDWFGIPFDDDFACIMGCALRYALSRETFMPALIADYIKKFMNHFDVNTIGVMINDIDTELANGVAKEDVWRDLSSQLKEKHKELLGLTSDDVLREPEQPQ